MVEPDFPALQSAAQRLQGIAVRTPLLTQPALDKATARQVFLKPETLQITGSFKFRGAYNRLSVLSDADRRAGVIAWSSGNHAQGIAAAAGMLGIHARIVMPEDAPPIKLHNTRALGADIITYDRYRQSREELAYALAEREGGVIVPSFDDPHIIAGQGTVGLECFKDAAQRGRNLDALLVCCGGGGLTAGCALAAEALSPDTDLFTVEPAGYDDYARSLAAGQIESADTSQQSICDALLTPSPGELTFSINRKRVKAGLTVSEEEVKAAVTYAFRELKLVAEPGGAVALAALLQNKLDAAYQRVGVVLSGGNIDPALFAQILQESS
ncbi:MAG: threonine/serine dehydratase [Pseudomonadota bacterium]